MLWRLLQVHWLVLVLDLKCLAFPDTNTLKLKTKNNGKIDPFSFEVFPTSRSENFGKFSKNEKNFFEDEETDPDMALFFKDMDFFDNDDDDTFYQSPFSRKNTTKTDFFSRSLEESRNRYMEDVNNIDKMFQTPVKSNIDELLLETTHDDESSKNLNSSQQTGVETIERNVSTTRKNVEMKKTNSSNTQIPTTNSINSDNPPKPNNSLFSDSHKASGSSVVAKLVPVTEKHNKDVVDNGGEKDENREARGRDINKGLLDSQDLKLEVPFMESMNVVTEISVQEMVNGKMVQRKPSSEELLLIEEKMSTLPTPKSNKTAATISPETQDYQELNQNENAANNLLHDQEENAIDDLSSFLKIDPNFADEGMDKMLGDDEEVRDMDVILSDKDDEYNNSNQERESTNKETSKKSEDNKHRSQGTDETDVDRSKEDSKSKHSTTNGDREDPRNYRKIFHTEHKNLSNVSDVKIMFSETEGDFLDDDDSEYSLNIPETPEIEAEKKTAQNINRLEEQSEQMDDLEDIDEESVTNKASSSQGDRREIEEYDQNNGVRDSDELTTILSKTSFVTEPVQVTESSYMSESYEPGQTTENMIITENIPNFTEIEELLNSNPKEESTSYKEFGKAPTKSKETENLLNIKSNIEDKITISSQNINDTVDSEEPATEFYEDFNDPILDIPEVSFIPFNNRGKIDNIDRTIALMKQILSESGSSEESENQETTSKNLEENDRTTTEAYNDVSSPNIEEITIPLDISTIPIDLTSSTEEFIETTTDFKEITTERFKKEDFSDLQSVDVNVEVGSGIVDPTEDSKEEISYFSSTDSNLAFSTTIDTILNTETSRKSSNDVDTFTLIDSTTDRNIVTTTKIDEPAKTSYSVVEVVNTDVPSIINFKETEVEPHELSSSEVESLYNSKIEEYESLEDSSDLSGENVAGWTLFGNKNKEYESKMKKDNGQKERKIVYDKKAGVVKVASTISSDDDKQQLVDTDSFKDVPILRGTVLNNSAEFSIKVSKQDETFYVPSSAHIREYANIINITWETNEYLNNSIALRVVEKEYFYMIKEVMINLLTGNEFIKQKKPVAFNPDPILDDSITGNNRIVMMKDGTYIFFSNVDFLKKSYEPLEYSEASMRERRLWHIEIASICLAVVAIIAIVLYVLAVKTKRKVTLREKNELAQVTHC